MAKGYNGKNIAIIGASYLQLPLIRLAKELGLTTYVFAWQDGATGFDYIDHFYPISIVDKEEILEVCKNVGIDAVLSIGSDVAVITVNYIAHNLGLVGNSLESTEWQTNKYSMRRRMAECKLPIPAYQLVHNYKDIDLDKLNFPLIIKPVDRSGSRGVTKIDSINDLELAVERALGESFIGQAVLEQFVAGSEVSVESISWNSEHTILAITDKETTGSPNYIETGHHQPSQKPEAIQAKIKSVTQEALNALGVVWGAGHTELMITDTGDVYIIEVGARMGGDFIGSHLTQLSTEYNFLKSVIDVSLNIEPEKFSVSANRYSGIKFLFNKTDSLKEIITTPSTWPDYVISAEYFQNIANDNNVQSSSDRLGYLIYCSNKKENI